MPRHLDPDLIPNFVEAIDTLLLSNVRHLGRVSLDDQHFLIHETTMVLGLDDKREIFEFSHLVYARMAFLGLADRVDARPGLTVADAARLVNDRVALALLDTQLALFDESHIDNLEKTASLILRVFGDPEGQHLPALMNRVWRTLAELAGAPNQGG